MNYLEARDAILKVFNDAWGDRHAVWTDLPSDIPSDGVWARPTLRHDLGGQSSLGDGVGTILYDNSGTLFIQVFTPMGQGAGINYVLCQMLVSAYRKAKGEEWYRNARMQEIGPDGAFLQHNVLVDFTYSDKE